MADEPITNTADESRAALLNVLEDLTAAKEQLEAAEAYDEALLSGIADGVIALDTSGRVTRINVAAQRLLGISADDAIGRDMHEVAHMVDEAGTPVPRENRDFLRALKGETIVDDTHLYQRPDGTVFAASIRVSPVMDGFLRGVVQVFRDVTMERQLDRAKTEFVTLASHQLRAPLNALNWYTELLLTDTEHPLSVKQREYIGEIRKTNKRMTELIDAFLNVSRLEMGVFPNRPEEVPIVPLVKSVLDEFDEQIRSRQLTVQDTYDPAISTVNIDARLFALIVQNLLSNAVKYTPSGGTVSVHVGSIDGHLGLTVTDTGIGISGNEQPRVFQKLFRGDNAQTMEPEGTGLGLYIVKTIVTQAGGTITFISVEGKGSTFSVLLPLGPEKKSA
ncbi:MAG TPA: ATP-binding protein [Candidatus Paceibacterota bacterium]|nr:ATP-binding protein [Candidatus Paceibacterota bacterium]